MISSDPSTIAELLLITFLGSTDQIRQAERKLKELEQDQKFLENLMEIPKQPSNPYNIRKAAVLYTLTYCRARHSSFKQQNLLNLAKFLFSKLAEDSLQIYLRRHLINTISYLLTADKNGRVKYVLYQECLIQCKQASENMHNMQKIIFVGLAVQTTLLVTIHNTNELCEFIRGSLLYFVEISLKLFENAGNLVNQNGARDSLVSILEVIKIYSSTLKLYLKKIAYSDLQTVRLLFQPKLCALISKLWEFDFKQNSIKAVIIFYGCNNDWQVLQQHHSIKADYMQSLTIINRSVFQYFKEPKTLATHELINKPFIIPLLISTLESINIVCPHYKIKSSSLIKLIEEIMNYLIFSVKITHYSQIFHNKRKELIENCLFKMLQFSPEDYSKMISDPEQFINELMQIIEMDPTEFLSNRKKQYDIVEEPEDVQSYTTLKTVAATLLHYTCKNIDGTTSEILAYAQKWLSSPDSSKFTNSLLILILGILRDIICERTEDSQNVTIFLTNRLKQSPPPPCLTNLNTITQEEKERTMEYLLLLLTIQKYLNRIKNIAPSIISTLYPIISSIMASNEVQQCIKISAYEFVIVLVNRDLSFKYSRNFLQLSNQLLLTVAQNSGKVLEVIFNLIKFKGEEILGNIGLVAMTLTNLRAVVEREVERADLGDKDIINKCWNIITDISQFEQFVQVLSTDIENTIVALSRYIDGKNHVEYQDQIFLALNALICIKKQVTANLLQIFDIIPKLFYNKFECKFEQSFETINLFLEYGANILKNNQQGTKVLLQMAIVSMSTKKYKNVVRDDSDCCQGVLLLQNLIICCGESFTKDIWEPIVTSLLKKLDSGCIDTVILKANVIATIGLCLMAGYSCFNPETYSILLTQIVKNKEILCDKHSNKIATIALCDIIGKQKNTSVTVFQSLLDIMKLIRIKQHKLQRAPMEEMQKQYENSLTYIKNPIISLNESTYFKHMINTLKAHDHQKLEEIMKQLPEQKVEFLKEFLSTAKVNNETRQIFKIKR